MTQRRLFRTGRTMALAGLIVLGLAGPGFGQDKTLTFDRSIPQAQTRPEPLMIGVGVHFGIGGEYNYKPDVSARLIGELGFDSFRDDLPWGTFTRPGSTPDFPHPRRLYSFLDQAKAKPLIILGHPNAAVPGGQKPLTDPAARAAFVDYAVRGAASLKRYDAMFEVWNEWNLAPNTKPHWVQGAGTADDPRAAMHYAALARATIAAVRAADPNALVLSGAAGDDPGWGWTLGVVREGGLTGSAGLSVHVYNHCERPVNRTATELADRLYKLQAGLTAQTGAAVPVWVTEVGWPTVQRGCVVSREDQANNIAQFLLWSAATPWMKGAWLYELKDNGENPDDLQHNFGLYGYNYEPKPAVCATREAIRLIREAKNFRLERPSPDVFVLQTVVNGKIRLVAWTSRKDVTSTLKVKSGGPFEARPLCGLGGPVARDTLALGPAPVVVDLEESAVTVSVSKAP